MYDNVISVYCLFPCRLMVTIFSSIANIIRACCSQCVGLTDNKLLTPRMITRLFSTIQVYLYFLHYIFRLQWLNINLEYLIVL